ncbi:MAG: hypothetical protein KGI02_07770 [Thaumarchaeota archaeon]|nr:hypothetical protein [Nitrososphaerota archaeon]MDE1840546.1 hypothetical protein [Nitrososphaerota archaeon]MDE1877718.1 hypothetical protein [Nitrososphaerota archaeon]
MNLLDFSMIVIGLVITIFSFGISHVQAQRSDAPCVNITDLAKSIIPPNSEGFPMFKNYTLRCTTMSGSAIQMDYMPNVTPVANLQTNLNSQSMIAMITGSGNDISTTVHAGQAAHVPVKIQVKDGYSISSAQFSMVNLPPRVQSWTDPRDSGFLANQPVNGSLANATINIYVDSGAKSGSYDIGIAADGSMMDSAGKYIQLNQSEIGMLHLTISGQDNIWSDVGLPDVHQDTMCLDIAGSGRSCSGFPAYEEYPVTVYGQGQKVAMSVPDLPAGKYVRFVPSDVTATPRGTSLKMIAAGIVRPGAPNALFTPVATIVAQSSDGAKSSSYIPIAETQNITVIHSPGPIAFTDNFGGNGQQGFGISGVVYDPLNYTDAPLHVKLSVLGIDNGTIIPMPSWLSVSIPDSLFDLVPTVPYYFMLNFSSTNASLGTYPVAIKEDMGDSSFVQDVLIKIYNPPRFGGLMLGPSVSPTPVSVGVTSSDMGNAVVLAGVGVPIAAVVSAGVILSSRKKR